MPVRLEKWVIMRLTFPWVEGYSLTVVVINNESTIRYALFFGTIFLFMEFFRSRFISKKHDFFVELLPYAAGFRTLVIRLSSTCIKL